MIVSLKNKVIFIGVPHTGSTSIHEYVKHQIMTGDEMIENGFDTYESKDWIYCHGDYKHAGIEDIENFLRKNDYDLSGKWVAYYSFRDPVGFHSSDYYLRCRLARKIDWCKEHSIAKTVSMQKIVTQFPTVDQYLLEYVTPHKWFNHLKIMNRNYLFRGRSHTLDIEFRRRDYTREGYSKTFKEVVEALGLEVKDMVHVNDSKSKREPIKPETLVEIQKMIDQDLTRINSFYSEGCCHG